MTEETLYHGLYINLDRSPARREAMEAQLEALGLAGRYARFPAVDGATLGRRESRISPGETGAFASHMAVLAQAPRGGPVHILEDDALLSGHVRPVIEEAIAAGLFERFDILFTDTLLAPHLGMLKGLKAIMDRLALPPLQPLKLSDLQVIDLAAENFSCVTSYVVAPAAMARLSALYRAEWEAGPNTQIDLFIRNCVRAGRLRAGLLFPFVTSFRLEEAADSTVGAGVATARPSVMVLAVLRYLFFVGRDLEYAKACLDAATKKNRRPVDRHHEMTVQALEFVLSADFQTF